MNRDSKIVIVNRETCNRHPDRIGIVIVHRDFKTNRDPVIQRNDDLKQLACELMSS